MEISNETADKLSKLAETKGKEEEAVIETFKEKYEEVQERASGLSDDRKEEIAYRATRTNLNADDRVPVSEVEIATVGGTIRNWNVYDDDTGEVVGDKDVLLANGVVDTDPNSDRSTEFMATIIFDETNDIDVPAVKEAFSRVGNIVRGEFSVSEADVDGCRVLNAQDSTEVTVIEPENRDAVVEQIREVVPEFTIENVADNLSSVERVERKGQSDTFRPVNFGVDFRRINADIYDSYKNPSKGFGFYTVRDDTVFDEEDIAESAVFDPDAQTPGLSVMADLDLMEYGTETIADFYGTVTKDENGKPQMRAVAIDPVYAKDFDGFVDSDEEDQEEEVESNVDRTSI